MKNDKIWIALFIIIFLAGIAGTAAAFRMSDGENVVITRDGKEIYRLDLAKYDEPREIEIKGHGGINRVLIKDGRIRMSYADCPDKTCVKAGWLDSRSMPIVCLPHHIAVEFADGNDSSSPDGVTGYGGS